MADKREERQSSFLGFSAAALAPSTGCSQSAPLSHLSGRQMEKKSSKDWLYRKKERLFSNRVLILFPSSLSDKCLVSLAIPNSSRFSNYSQQMKRNRGGNTGVDGWSGYWFALALIADLDARLQIKIQVCNILQHLTVRKQNYFNFKCSTLGL